MEEKREGERGGGVEKEREGEVEREGGDIKRKSVTKNLKKRQSI